MAMMGRYTSWCSGVKVGVGVGVMVGVLVGVGVEVGVAVMVGVLVGVDVEVLVAFGVLVGVLVGVPVEVGVGVIVGVLVGVDVEVLVGVGVGPVMSTEPSSVVPGTLWPNVLPNEAAGSSEKLTAASVAPGGLPTFSVMETIAPSDREARGGKRSAIKKSNSPSASPPSKVTEALNAPGRLKATASGMSSPLLSVESKVSQV